MEWKGYFDKLLNEENTRSIFDDGVPNEGLTQGISRNEVKVAISRMKNGKATGMDGIPVDVLKCFGRRRDRHAVGSDARDIRARENTNGVER